MESNADQIDEVKAQESAPQRKKSKVGKILGIIALLVILLAAGAVAWLSMGNSSELKDKVYRALPYPAAMVKGKMVMARDVLNRFDIAKKSIPPESGVSDAEIKQQVYDKLVEEEKASVLAGSRGVRVDQAEIDSQYQEAVEQLTSGDAGQFQEMLSQYGLNELQFKEQVLRPDLLVTKLVVWYNGQQDLNKTAHEKVQGVQQELSAGKSFEEAAAQHSQDAESKGMEGDLGFVEIDKLLPEFKSSLNSLQAGDIKLVASRYGLHLFKVEQVDNQGENGSQRMHLKQVFVETSGFDQWYQSETDSYDVKKFIKI